MNTPAHVHTTTPPVAGKPAEHKAETKSETKPETKPEAKELSLAEVTSAFMLPAELADTSAPVRARSEKQTAMDKKVDELHKAWVKGGKPGTWAKMVEAHTVVTYFVEPDKSAELHKLVNRSVAFLGLRSRMGTSFLVTEKHTEKFNLPKQYVGREAISFAIMDKRPRATSDGKSAGQVIANHADKK